MPRFVRMVLSVLVVTMLAATTALAQTPAAYVHPVRLAASAFPDLFAWLWSLPLKSRSKNGCSVDPNGVAGDNGCQVDPDGQRQAGQSTTKNGCELDPSGRCIR